MYIKLQRKDLPPVLSLCQNFISHFDSRAFPFVTPARTSTLVATAKIYIELLDCRIGPDPVLLLGQGSGPLRTCTGEGVFVSWGGPESRVAA